ncbi:MAG: SDR family oxidoreductase [Pirellulaceae bacterium]|nr:SDR family oxidoreductase [Pirellulaceae bacterium]
MARFLVTGGAGFIGSHLVERLVSMGEKVRVLDDLSTGHLKNIEPFSEKVEFVQGSLTDYLAVEKVVEGIEVVYHQGALASVPRSVANPLATNEADVTGTLNVLHAAHQAGVDRVIYAASSSAYGDQPFASKREADVPKPISPYAVAKLAGEHYCQAFYHSYGLKTICFRYFNVFGPRQDPHSAYSAVIPLFISRMLTDEQPIVFGNGLQSRDFTFIENVVHGNMLAATTTDEAAFGRTFNLANGMSTSLLTLIDILNEKLGTTLKPEFQPPRVGDVLSSMADITEVCEVLGYETKVHFEEGIERSIEYYQSVLTA